MKRTGSALSRLILLCATTAMVLPAQVFTTLHQFDGADGAYPEAALIQAADGALYGTTASAGANGGGTIFKMTPRGKLITLYNFCSQGGCADGEHPAAGLVQASNGDFYGTTFQGGTNGYGTIFEVTPSGTLTTLYSFCSQTGCPEDSAHNRALVQASNGQFYGTTQYGGANGSSAAYSNSPPAARARRYTAFAPK